MGLQIHVDAVPLRVNPDGVIYVGQTRVPLETVIHVFNKGASPEEIAFQFSALALSDIYLVIGYYLQHRDEVDIYIRQAEAHSAQVRRENESRFDPAGLRDRLLARTRQAK